MESARTIGRYRLDSWLASGAMGEVYRGHDPVIDRPVAIKLLRRELVQALDGDAWLQRFRREAQAAGRRFHPNIVTIFDFGEEDDVPFLAMEFIEGDSLDQLLKKLGRLDVERSLSIMKQVLSALGFVHGIGVVHRDIKPSNIIVQPDDHVKVADFSIARVDSSDLTIVGDVLGTPAYMAPEQLAGAPIDHRIDLFAAGVVLFEMLTGAKPFRGKSITEVMAHMRDRGPEDISVHTPEAPSALQEVFRKALAFEPEDRFSSAADFVKSLGGVAPMEGGFVAAAQAREAIILATAARAAAAEPVIQSPPTGEVIAEIEWELAKHIGPLARIAVQRSARNNGSVEELYRNLAPYIDNPADRTAFLAEGDKRKRAGADRFASTASDGRPAGAAAAATLTPDAVEPDILTRIESNLTQFIGPIARVIVRQQLSKSASLFDLYRDLATYIPDERERAEFLKRQNAG